MIFCLKAERFGRERIMQIHLHCLETLNRVLTSETIDILVISDYNTTEFE